MALDLQDVLKNVLIVQIFNSDRSVSNTIRYWLKRYSSFPSIVIGNFPRKAVLWYRNKHTSRFPSALHCALAGANKNVCPIHICQPRFLYEAGNLHYQFNNAKCFIHCYYFNRHWSNHCYCYFLGLPSPVWIPLLLMILWFEVDHPGLRRTEPPPRGFVPNGVKPLPFIAPPADTPANAPCPLPSKRNILFNRWGSLTQGLPHKACFIGPWAPVLPILGVLPSKLHILCPLAHLDYENPFPALARLWPQ